MKSIQQNNYAPVFNSSWQQEENGKCASDLVHRVILQKEENIEKALSDTWARYNPVTGSDTILVVGDVLNASFLLFEGIKLAQPNLAAQSGILVASAVCGVFGGVVSLSSGVVSLKEAVHSFQNGDTRLAARLFFEGVMNTVVGTAFLLLVLATKVAALAGVGAFFAANPWILPLALFLSCLPLWGEVASRYGQIYNEEDTLSKLPLNELRSCLEKKETTWSEIYALFNGSSLDIAKIPEEGLKELSERLEKLQAEMGVKSSLSAFKLVHALLKRDREGTLEKLDELEKEGKSWNQLQKRRFAQQIPILFSAILSLILLKPTSYNKGIEMTQNYAMAIASLAPLHMDLNYPLERDTPIIPKKAEHPSQNQGKTPCISFL